MYVMEDILEAALQDVHHEIYSRCLNTFPCVMHIFKSVNM